SGVTASVAGGVLNIQGTTAADTVRVKLDPGSSLTTLDDRVVVLSGSGSVVGSFLPHIISGGLSSITFHGSGGNDTFTNQTAIPCVAYGEGGNDTLTGGSGN